MRKGSLIGKSALHRTVTVISKSDECDTRGRFEITSTISLCNLRLKVQLLISRIRNNLSFENFRHATPSFFYESFPPPPLNSNDMVSMLKTDKDFIHPPNVRLTCVWPV